MESGCSKEILTSTQFNSRNPRDLSRPFVVLQLPGASSADNGLVILVTEKKLSKHDLQPSFLVARETIASSVA